MLPAIASHKFTGLVSFYHPAYLNENDGQLEVYFPFNGYVGMGNNFTKHSTIATALRGSQTTQAYLLGHPEIFRNTNRMRVDAMVFTFLAYYIPERLRGALAFNGGIADKAEMKLAFPGALMKVVLGGDQTLAGQNLQMDNIYVNALYYREFFIGGAAKIYKKKSIAISAGGRVKFLTGLASVLSRDAYVNVFMEGNGEYINADTEFEVQTSNILDGSSNLFNGVGNGIAADAGLSFFIKNFTVSVAALNIGGIRFHKAEERLQHRSSLRFEGFSADEGFKGIKDDTIFHDLTVNRSKSVYNHPLTKRLQVLCSWQSQMEEKLLFRKTLVRYSKHRVYFSFSGELDEFSINDFSNYICAGYVYNWKDFFEIGPGFFAGGNARLGIGCMASVKYKWFALGAGTSNLFPFIFQQGRGTDFSLNSYFSF